MANDKTGLIDRASHQAEALLATGHSPKPRARVTHRADKTLPKHIRKAAALVEETSNRALYQPFLLDSQIKSVEKAQSALAEFSTQKDADAKKGGGLGRWLVGLITSYLMFLLLLAAWWYFSTQT